MSGSHGGREMAHRPGPLGHWLSGAAIFLITAVGSSVFADEGGLAPLIKKGYVRVCADPDNLPFSSEAGSTPGFEVELARLIARELGVDARFHWILTWVRPFWELKRGECDLFMGVPPIARLKQSAACSRPVRSTRSSVGTTRSGDDRRRSATQ